MLCIRVNRLTAAEFALRFIAGRRQGNACWTKIGVFAALELNMAGVFQFQNSGFGQVKFFLSGFHNDQFYRVN